MRCLHKSIPSNSVYHICFKVITGHETCKQLYTPPEINTEWADSVLFQWTSRDCRVPSVVQPQLHKCPRQPANVTEQNSSAVQQHRNSPQVFCGKPTECPDSNYLLLSIYSTTTTHTNSVQHFKRALERLQLILQQQQMQSAQVQLGRLELSSNTRLLSPKRVTVHSLWVKGFKIG